MRLCRTAHGLDKSEPRENPQRSEEKTEEKTQKKRKLSRKEYYQTDRYSARFAFMNVCTQRERYFNNLLFASDQTDGWFD